MSGSVRQTVMRQLYCQADVKALQSCLEQVLTYKMHYAMQQASSIEECKPFESCLLLTTDYGHPTKV